LGQLLITPPFDREESAARDGRRMSGIVETFQPCPR
jgi:hypothetical protein